MKFETTILRPVEIEGIGLHHGAPVRLRITPAPVATGIVFIRTDLENTRIPASWEFVERVSYATSLMHPRGIFISTTEHLLSVLYSMGIDNAFLELDNLEVPILDGSGLPFVELIRRAGIQQYRRPRRYLKIVKPVSVEANGKRVAIFPSDRFQLRCHSFFKHPLVGEQNLDLDVTPEAMPRRLRLRVPSASNTSWTRCATWDLFAGQASTMRSASHVTESRTRAACASKTNAAGTKRSILSGIWHFWESRFWAS